jgi:hypothetical protein
LGEVRSRDPGKVDRATYLENADERSDDDGNSIESVMGGGLYTCKRTEITKYSPIKRKITGNIAAYLS